MSNGLGGNRKPFDADANFTYPDRPELFLGAVKDLAALQSKTLKEWLYTEDQGLLPPEDIYINSSHSEIATFAWNAPRGDEYVMLREKFDGVHSATSWKNGPIAARVKQLVDEQTKNPERQQPPNDLANFCMAKLMLEKHRTQKDKTILAAYFESGTGKQGKNKGKVFGTRWFKALDDLWKDKSIWPAIRVEYAQASENVLDAMKTIEKSYARSSKTPFEAHDRDEIAGSDPAILRPVTRKVIYLAVDAKMKVLLFRWPGAMVQMFGKGFTKKATEQLKSFVEYDPCPAPEPHRHAMTPHWLRQNPHFDKKREPKGVCGVYHVGIDDTMAHPKEGIHEKSDFLRGDANIQRIRGELMEGVLGCFTEASIFVQGILDPELLKKQQAAMREFPELKDPTTFTHPAEAYSTGAILINPKTESHVDSSDLIGGLAGMCPVGEFQKGDLCCGDLGVKLSFEDGDLGMIRGRELPHWTEDWTGKNRFCIVRAFHESVMKEAEARQEARAVGKERPTHSKRKQGDNLGKIHQNRGMPEMEQEEHPKDDPSDHRPAKRSKK